MSEYFDYELLEKTSPSDWADSRYRRSLPQQALMVVEVPKAESKVAWEFKPNEDQKIPLFDVMDSETAYLADVNATEAVVDTACTRAMSCTSWALTYATVAQKLTGLQSIPEHSTVAYSFAGGAPGVADYGLRVPTQLGSKVNALRIEAGPFGTTPCLFSLAELEDCYATIHFVPDASCISIPLMDVDRAPLRKNAQGLLCLDLLRGARNESENSSEESEMCALATETAHEAAMRRLRLRRKGNTKWVPTGTQEKKLEIEDQITKEYFSGTSRSYSADGDQPRSPPYSCLPPC